MHMVVGLGNPGRTYEWTRHNLGFAVVDALASEARAEFRPGRGEYWYAACSLNQRDVVLLKPTTYMNDSGLAVVQGLEHFAATQDTLLVVCDDFQLPLGTLRLRPRGSDGGHNGLASVIYQLASDTFPRLRCGIGSPAMPAVPDTKAGFVLEQFGAGEMPAVRDLIARARDASISVVTDGLDLAMSRFNTPRDRSDT